MSSTADSTPAADQPDPTIEELEADRAATRERLAASVEELAAKADVKARAKERANETAQQVKTTADEVVDRIRDLPPGVVAAAAVAVTVLAVLLIRQRRRSR